MRLLPVKWQKKNQVTIKGKVEENQVQQVTTKDPKKVKAGKRLA